MFLFCLSKTSKSLIPSDLNIKIFCKWLFQSFLHRDHARVGCLQFNLTNSSLSPLRWIILAHIKHRYRSVKYVWFEEAFWRLSFHTQNANVFPSPTNLAFSSTTSTTSCVYNLMLPADILEFSLRNYSKGLWR